MFLHCFLAVKLQHVMYFPIRMWKLWFPIFIADCILDPKSPKTGRLTEHLQTFKKQLNVDYTVLKAITCKTWTKDFLTFTNRFNFFYFPIWPLLIYILAFLFQSLFCIQHSLLTNFQQIRTDLSIEKYHQVVIKTSDFY